MSKQHGFTLIEVLIVVAIVAILAAVAIPAYGDYIQRAKIAEATQGLSDMRTKMEQYFLDNRTYVSAVTAGACPVANYSGKHFDFTCVLDGTTGYDLAANGRAADGMTGFGYTLNEMNTKGSTVTKSGWSASTACWQTKKGGVC